MGTVDEDLAPPLPKGFTPAKKTDAVPPLPKGFTPSTDFTHGYKPTSEDIKTKQSYEDLENSFDSTPGFRKPDLKKSVKTDLSPLDSRSGTWEEKPKGTVEKIKPRLLTKQEEKSYDKGVAIPTMQVEGADRKANSWENLGDFVPQTVMSGLDKDAGQALEYLGNSKTLFGENGLPKLADIGKKLEGFGETHQDKADQYQLPNTTTGNVVSTAIAFAPDMIELALTPELDIAKIGKLSEVLGKYGSKALNLTVGKLPIQQGSKGLVGGYSEAKSMGMSDEEANKYALKKGLDDYGKGLIFEAAVGAASKVSDIGKKYLESKGFPTTGIGSATQRAILHSTAQAAAFSAVPFISNALDGKGTSLKQMKENAVFGGILGLFHGDTEGSDGSAKAVLDRTPLIDMHNFMSADMDAIKLAHDAKSTPADLQMKSATHAQDAFKSDEPTQKQEDIVESSINGKLASVKSVTQSILKDKDGVIQGVQEFPVSDETKQAIIDKVNQVHKELDPAEREKTELGRQIGEKDAQISQLSEKTTDPVKNAENEVNLEQATKDREELNNKLKQLIVKQHETKNEGDAGHPAKTEEVNATAQQTGQDERAVHPEREHGQEGLTQGGEEPPLTKQDNATKQIEQQESGGAEHQNGDESRKTEETGDSNSAEHKEADLSRQQRVGDTESENEAKSERVKPTSIKKVITEATRQERELPDVELSKFKGDSPTLEHGKKLVGTGEVKPNEVIDRVTSGKGIYTPDEAAAMQYHMHQLRAADEDLRTQLADVDKKLESVPNDKQHKDARDLILGNIRQLDDRIEEATRANRINSRSWSNLGNTMQIEADHTFSPANIRGIIRDNYGGEIPKDVQARLDAAIKERDKALSDLKRATENATTKQGRATVEKIRKSVGLVKMSKSELEAEAETLKSDLRKAIKSDFSRVNSGIPIPTETLAVLGKLAVNYFKQGVKDFEGLVNRIHDDLKDTGVDKAQVREYLSNYEPLRDESKSRRVELLGRKERSINKQLETGKLRDYSRKPEITFKKDNEVTKAEQRVKDAEFKLKQEKAKSYNKTKSGTQRGLDWLIRWERRFVLSSPAILEKLASAVTIGGALRRAPEEVVGGMWTKMLPALMNKAPIEGGFNAKAEAAYWKDFSNPRKFLHNAREILKTGASDLTKEFSDKPHEHYQYYDALTDLHPIIKDISKRATYEASLIKGLHWAEGQGLDVSDPLIRQNIKQMAYNRAEYEIFQENSGWNRKLQKFLSDERTPKNTQEMLTRFATRFLMPVSTVPLNIARRIGNYATGLPRGLSNAIEAYKSGIENLTNEQAEITAKQLKQGTMGAALFSIGLFGVGGSYGGFYNKDDRGGLDRTGVFDPGFDQMYFGKQKIDKPIQHALPLQLIQLGATMRNIHKLYMDKYATSDEYNSALEKQLKATSQAAMVSAAAIAEQVPMIEEPFELIGAFKDPYMRKKFAQGMKRRVTPTILTDAEKLIKK